MSLSVKNLLNKRYQEFRNELNTIGINTEMLFPDVEENTNWIEAIEILLFLFPSDDTKSHLDELLLLKNVVILECQFLPVCELIDKYKIFLKKIKNVL